MCAVEGEVVLTVFDYVAISVLIVLFMGALAHLIPRGKL
jgi:hypothetical protein